MRYNYESPTTRSVWDRKQQYMSYWWAASRKESWTYITNSYNSSSLGILYLGQAYVRYSIRYNRNGCRFVGWGRYSIWRYWGMLWSIFRSGILGLSWLGMNLKMHRLIICWNLPPSTISIICWWSICWGWIGCYCVVNLAVVGRMCWGWYRVTGQYTGWAIWWWLFCWYSGPSGSAVSGTRRTRLKTNRRRQRYYSSRIG